MGGVVVYGDVGDGGQGGGYGTVTFIETLKQKCNRLVNRMYALEYIQNHAPYKNARSIAHAWAIATALRDHEMKLFITRQAFAR